jgi:hypothetical protein
MALEWRLEYQLVCGKMLLNGYYRSFPNSADEYQKVIELVERLGVLMIYFLTRNLIFSQETVSKNVYEWITQIMIAEYLMNCFKNESPKTMKLKE